MPQGPPTFAKKKKEFILNFQWGIETHTNGLCEALIEKSTTSPRYRESGKGDPTG